MRADQLPTPGPVTFGYQIRNQAAQAISQLQIAASRIPGNKAPGAKQLKAFFTACATACDALIDSVAPTVASRVAPAASPTLIRVTFSEAVTGAPLPAAFAVAGSPSLTVQSVDVTAKVVTLTMSGTVIPGTHTVAYTQPTPVVQRLQDGSKNYVASFTASAIVAG